MFFHPIKFLRTSGEVIRLTGDYNTIQTMERRKAKVEDVQKRDAYRKAHGLDKDEGFGGWTARGAGEEMGSGLRIEEKKEDEKVEEKKDENRVLNLGDGKLLLADGTIVLEKDQVVEQAEQAVEKRPVKQWFGIW
jgi:hypothetical protein